MNMLRHDIHTKEPCIIILLMICMSFLMQVSGQTGLPDNIMITDCTTDAQQQPWDAQVLMSANDIHCYYVPLVGDIDGDGIVEIVAGKALTNDHYTTQVGIYRGTDLQLIGTINVSQKIYAGYAGPMAIVRYPDGNGGMQGAVVLHCYDNKLRSYNINGQLIATSNVNTPCEGVVSVTDFNYDGWPEIYIGNAIYDAATLTQLCAGDPTGYLGRSYRCNSTEKGRCAMSFAANVLGDSIPELICGNTLYQVNIVSRTNVSQNSINVLKTVNIPTRVPQDGNVAVADFDLDGQLDVLVIIDGTSTDYTDSAYIYAYNPVTENILFVHGKYAKTIGYPMVGDIDGDNLLEFVYLDYQQSVSQSRITAIRFNPQTGLETKWQATHNDQSGQTTMTLFDFNQDGIMEIVYRDEQNLRIINGSGKSHRTGNDTIPFYNLYTKGMTAGTWKEYPVVADVNNDGRAEVVVCGKMTTGLGWVGGQLVVIGGIHPWAPARPVWNQYLYNVTNVNADLTIPIPLFNNATVFTDPQSMVCRPFNNFLQQATTLDQYGKPFMTLANATVNDAEIFFEDQNTSLSFQVCNTGSQILSSPFYITYYVNEYQGTILQTATINNSLPPGDCSTIQVTFSNEDLSNYPNIENIVISVNDNGHGVAQYGNQQEECDTSDNFAYLSPCPSTRDTVLADICVRESYHDENFDIDASETENSGTKYYSRTFQTGTCDSIIVLKLQVHPAYEMHFTETISQGSDYDRHGIFLSESVLGDQNRIDTSITFQSEYGCDSTIYITIQIAVSEITLYLPNAITPSKSDGVNDGFSLPETIQNQIDDFEISIFNRWGEMVFYSNDKNFCWHGEYKGKTYYNNVYQYVIHYSNHFGKKFTTKGTITVL